MHVHPSIIKLILSIHLLLKRMEMKYSYYRGRGVTLEGEWKGAVVFTHCGPCTCRVAGEARDDKPFKVRPPAPQKWNNWVIRQFHF